MKFNELFTTLAMQFRTEATETEYLFHAYGKDFFILEVNNIYIFMTIVIFLAFCSNIGIL